MAPELGLTPAQLLAVPYVLIGTADEIVEAVRAHRERWDIARYVVREDTIDDVEPLLPRLAEV